MRLARVWSFFEGLPEGGGATVDGEVAVVEGGREGGRPGGLGEGADGGEDEAGHGAGHVGDDIAFGS